MSDLPHSPHTPVNEEDADLFDYQAIRAWLGFTWRSIRRHLLWGAGAFVIVFSVAAFAATFMPKKYQSEARLLANRNTVMATLGNPHRNMPTEIDGPTRAAQEQVLARDNLVTMIKQLKLLEHWDATRNPVMGFKDSVMRMLTGPISDDQKIDNMVGTLEKRFNVYSTDNMIVISVYWHEPTMARQIVETAQQNFLEARHVSEVSAISEAISILEMHASETQSSIDEAINQVQKVAEERKRGVKKEAAASAPAAPARPRVTTAETPQQELSQLKFLIRTKRRAIADLDEFRQRRLTELTAQLAEQRVMYSASHPVIVDIQQRIEGLQKESPQILALKRDEEGLIEEYKTRGGRDPNSLVEPTQGGSTLARGTFDADTALSAIMDMRDDPAITVARDQLRMATARYQDLLMRLDSARIELDTTRAAFKYRYTAVKPAQTPRQPISPNVALIYIGGILGGLMVAFFTTLMLDVWKGRIVETWQVERRLKLPVLAELRL